MICVDDDGEIDFKEFASFMDANANNQREWSFRMMEDRFSRKMQVDSDFQGKLAVSQQTRMGGERLPNGIRASRKKKKGKGNVAMEKFQAAGELVKSAVVAKRAVQHMLAKSDNYGT
jgi:hypothetical protein